MTWSRFWTETRSWSATAAATSRPPRPTPTGLFSFDTRFLSEWVLTVNGQRLNALSTDDLQYFESRFFLVPGTGTVYVDSKLSVIRTRAVGDGFHEQLTILNHDEQAGQAEGPDRRRERLRRPVRGQGRAGQEGCLQPASAQGPAGALGYARETFQRETVISPGAPARIDKTGFTFTVKLEPKGRWSTDIRRRHGVWCGLGGSTRSARPTPRAGGATWSATSTRWMDKAPRLECDWDSLKSTYRRSLVDLAALRFSPLSRRRAAACRRPACPGS